MNKHVPPGLWYCEVLVQRDGDNVRCRSAVFPDQHRATEWAKDRIRRLKAIGTAGDAANDNVYSYRMHWVLLDPPTND